MRSLLFAPGNHDHRVGKALGSGADVVILDLEDGIAKTEKAAARAAVVANLQRQRRCKAFVRINAVGAIWSTEDLYAVVGPWVDGIVLPKAEKFDELAGVDAELTRLEMARQLPLGHIELLPLIESATGITALEDLLQPLPRVRRLAFGVVDYVADLNILASETEEEVAYARARLTHCSRSAGLQGPIDGAVIQFREPAAFLSSARRARRLGFQGKLCIHPDQVAIANEIFSPSPAEVAQAWAILHAFAQGESRGVAAIQLNGIMIDYAVVRHAQAVVSLCETPPTKG